MLVDQDRRVAVLEAELALEKAKRVRGRETCLGAMYALPGVTATIIYYFYSGPGGYLALLALFSAANIMAFAKNVERLNTVVRKKRKKVEELSGG